MGAAARRGWPVWLRLPWRRRTTVDATAALSLAPGLAGWGRHRLASRLRLPWAAVLAALAVYVVLRPLIGLGHELTVAALAWGVRGLVMTGIWQPIVGLLGLDPIYTGAAIRAAGGVEVLGLAIAGPLGAWLHGLLPVIFQPPEQVVDGAGISMVAGPGTPALGRGVAAFGADVVWLGLGLWLFWTWRRRSWFVSALGLLIQAHIAINHLLDAQVNLPDLEASGLPFAVALAMPSAGSGGWFTTALARLPSPLQETIVGGTLLLLGYVGAVAGLLIVAGLRRLVARRMVRGRRRWRLVGARPPASVAYSVRLATLAGSVLAIVIAISPVGALAVGESNWQAAPASLFSATRGLAPSAAGRLRLLLRAPRPTGPVVVSLEHAADGSWRYLVDGQPTIIRGVGYNPQYASLSAADRARLYDRDFGAMRQLGINTIEGWFENQFDEQTLDAAERAGIGVMMPFELNQDWNYADPAVQQSILDRVSAWVERYRSHPAVRMWAPGNEDLHRILYPRWVSQEHVPEARARADAFARFLPVLVDRIHELDPNHPVVYRDAEDVYLGRLKAAFQATGVERPWLMYGANVYAQPRLRDIIAAWPSQWLGGPLLISEFAPGGVGPAERPVGFQQDWAIIRSRPNIVIGGLAYTWATNGPEELDRVFGLVDANGVPTDGALAALSASYLRDDAPMAASAPPSNR